MKAKKLSCSLSTGDKFTYNGSEYVIGLTKKGKIDLRVYLSPTSCYTIQVSTRELNKMINN